MGVTGVILSSDEFFLRGNKYVFDRNLLGEAHEWNKKRALRNAKESRSPIIIDNTNTTLWELLPYAVLALEFRYDVQLFEPDTPWKFKVGELVKRNVHSVARENIHRMKDRYETLSLEQVLKEASKVLSKRKPNSAVLVASETPIDETSPANFATAAAQPSVKEAAQTAIGAAAGASSSSAQYCNSIWTDDSWGDAILSSPQPQRQKSSSQTKRCSDQHASQSRVNNIQITPEFLRQSLKEAKINTMNSQRLSSASSEESFSNFQKVNTTETAVTLQSKDSHSEDDDLPQLCIKNTTKNNDLEPNDICKEDSEENLTECKSESSTSDTAFVSATESSLGSTSESFRSCSSGLDSIPENKIDAETQIADNIHTLLQSYKKNILGSVSSQCKPVTSSTSASRKIESVSRHAEADDDYQPDSADSVVEDKGVFFQSVYNHEGDQVLSCFHSPTGPSPQQFLSAEKSSEGRFNVATERSKTAGLVCGSESDDHVDPPAEPFKTKPHSLEGTSVDLPGAEETSASVKIHLDSQSSNSEASSSQGSRNCSSEKDRSNTSLLVNYSDSDVETEDLLVDNEMAPDQITGKAVNSSVQSIQDVTKDSDQAECTIIGDSAKHGVSVKQDHDSEKLHSCSFSPDRVESAPSSNNSLLVVSPTKKKRVRVRRGKRQGPFLEDTLKEKSKVENWSTFIPPFSASANLVNPDPEERAAKVDIETRSVLSQCDPYMFSMVHKLNSPSFNSLQPVDDSAICDDEERGLRIVSSSSQSHVHETQRFQAGEKSDSTLMNRAVDQKIETGDGESLLPRKLEMADRSTSTDDALGQEQIDLETLQSCFPEYSRRQLEQVMAICDSDLEWVTAHLLDSPALIDLEEDGNQFQELEDAHNVENGFAHDVPELEGEKLKSGGSNLNMALAITGQKNPSSLAELCETALRKFSHVDSDDLEIQVIKAGQSRLQRIEQFHWTRNVSQGSRPRQDGFWMENLRLEDFTGTVEPEECWELQPFSKIRANKTPTQMPLTLSQPPPSHKPIPVVFPKPAKSEERSYLSSLMEEKTFSAPLRFSKSDDSNSYPSDQELDEPEEGEVQFGSSLAEPIQNVTLSTSKAVVPEQLISSLEKLFGPLGLADKSEGLVLDDYIAEKMYRCLKLQVANKKIVTAPLNCDTQNDEAMARALQEEENLRSGQNLSGLQSSSHFPPSQVHGWTSNTPSWMLQTSLPAQTISANQRLTGNQNLRMKNSVSDTLHQLRGNTCQRKLTPFKFHRHHYDMRNASIRSKGIFGMGSAWAGDATGVGSQADSLYSIMEEQKAVEASQQEKMLLLKAAGDDHALATKIKRAQLNDLFPTLASDFLEEVFMQNGFSMEKTVEVLESTYDISPSPLARQEIEDAMVKSAEDVSRRDYAQHSAQANLKQEDETFVYDEDPNSVSYQDLRAEAQFYRGLAKDCQEQASRHHREGMHGAALFYRQRAKQYKEEEHEANYRAAQFLFDKGSERLDKENTLDLHFYHLDEAIEAVNAAISLKEEEHRSNPSKRSSYLNVVTGRGRNSKGGIPRLKPAIISHLKDRCLLFEERSPGMLRVQLGQRL
ncbi:nedd4-binding protein 2-like [Plakobranchus ocellatus]|uniref:Nedd4-binding protein 2-like n=1 Tax=Plakobranchus ocellatus TaxID=259542 RepID=A0AAV3XYC4_9GAST|nr:nedd4-binding protein 2-like [Plakobranchus ocellatus]